MVKVEISTDTRYPVNRKVIRKAVLDVIFQNRLTAADVEISVSVIGARKMKNLLKDYLDDGDSHSVLAFALEDVGDSGGGFVNAPSQPLVLGDIVICWPELLREAAEEDVMVDARLAFLVSHATEHLLGEHHEE
ncbi:rRNA maturation RNase YbeY [Candidatus Curtissbacteria bacterium]|nr:rRNA maturation RNase YbeY [Candidatus Curtissbacteria bacterium]